MSKHFLAEEVEKEICDLYLSGWGRRRITDKYHIGDPTLKKILQNNNIHIKSLSETNVSKFKIDEKYFELDKQTRNSAYILGILASDGCVASKENCIYIELQQSDRKILEKINKEIKNERPVKDYHNNSKNYDNSKLYFFSKKIKQDLALFNIIPNKTSYDNDFMENINKEYLIDYIRGHFDGDGSIKWANGTIQWQIDSTSKKTLTHMQKALANYNINSKIVLHTEECKDRNRTKDLYRIYFYGFKNANKLYYLFYNNPNSLRLERKQKHFYDLLMKYKTHETSVLIDAE